MIHKSAARAESFVKARERTHVVHRHVETRPLIVRRAGTFKDGIRAFPLLLCFAARGTEVVIKHGDKRRFADAASREVGQTGKEALIRDEKQW
jgi:hypothetical protein